ncbi:MAG: hypothetical protein KJ950_07975 [Proteobacteria bacterium]|nr:hypothetical protein [Pseudomonadota bacterium]MBU1686429.1 hypothetical protein [Pseudomonadota bacterium]
MQDFDPELKYCPKCKDEYRAEIERCAGCGDRLLSGLEMLNGMEVRKSRKSQRSNTLSPEDDLVKVSRGPLNDMKVYRMLLEGEGIATLLAGDDKSCGKGCGCGNFDLVVRRSDGADAMRMIEDEIRRTTRLADHQHEGDSVYDASAKEVVCPACGHRFATAAECPDCGLCF